MSMTDDILAARYFKNGEKSREEVYQRVSNFIGDSEEDKEYFYKLMCEDKFLPNSPTLMNAGAVDEPFMSACVVLPIEDTMESIFGSVKNAAICHQRGAGCIAEGSQVFTKHGIVKIEEVHIGDEVWSVNSKTGKQSYCKVLDTHIYDTENKIIVKVLFEGKGNYTITSDYHPFTVLTPDGKYEFVQAKDLKYGDEVVYGNTSKLSEIKFNPTAYKSGLKYVDGKTYISSPRYYTDSYIVSYLAGILKECEYEMYADASFEGTFEDYVSKVQAKTGDAVLGLRYTTPYRENIDLLSALMSKVGIKFGFKFVKETESYLIFALIQLNTVSHLMFSYMFDGIKIEISDKPIVNTIKVLAVSESECNRLRDLTVEKNNTYFAGTSGALCFIHNTGFSFDKLRAQGALVHSSQGKASGPVSFMQVFDKATSVVSQGGSRRGANMGIISVNHPDILKFVKCKHVEGDIQNFNISIMVTDEFMNDVINKRFDKVVSEDYEGHQNTVGEIWNEIVYGTWKNGEPGILFYNTINRDNTVLHLGNIESTNPCGEQPLLPYESCTLGSINLSKYVLPNTKYSWLDVGKKPNIRNVMDIDLLAHDVRACVRFLDSVVSKNVFPIKELKEMAEKTRKIGLGLMGVHDTMLLLDIPYDSADALYFIDDVMEIINKNAFEESKHLAALYGEYPAFQSNLLYCGREETNLPSRNNPRKFAEEWNNVAAAHCMFSDQNCNPMKLRNASLTTIAPTGTISLLAGCSSGIEPVFSYVYKRKNVVGNEYMVIHPIFEQRIKEMFKDEKIQNEIFEHVYERGTIQDLEYIPNDFKRVFKCALDISPEWHIRIQAAFQAWIMSSISKTINMPESSTIEDIEESIKFAYSSGCKGLTIYRTNSRSNVVLNLKDTTKPSVSDASDKSNELKNAGVDTNTDSKRESYIFERDGKPLTGRTYNIQSGCCKLYVTINHDENNVIREVFVQNSGGNGGCVALLGTLGRLTSLKLQDAQNLSDYNNFDRLLRSLSKTTCAACIRNHNAEAKSCSAAVAKCLAKEYEFLQKQMREDFISQMLPEIDLKKIIDCAIPDESAVIDDKRESVNTDNSQKDIWICPECGAKNVGVQGCKTCTACGFSKCG